MLPASRRLGSHNPRDAKANDYLERSRSPSVALGLNTNKPAIRPFFSIGRFKPRADI